jgi:hypothetical protein
MNEPRSLTALLKEHILLPGESLSDLRDQFKKLTEKDKKELRMAFVEMGFPVQEPAPPLTFTELSFLASVEAKVLEVPAS